jgi:hypothetical protein
MKSLIIAFIKAAVLDILKAELPKLLEAIKETK